MADRTSETAIDFEQHRAHLCGVAYRMLGSLAEAEDAVQEAWLRLERAAPPELANPRGWLTTVVSRICLDQLRARSARREEPFDTRADRPAAFDVAQELVLADSVGLALLIVLDRLEPAERLAFVLHDLFGIPFDEIAGILSRSSEATRQLASRARRRVQGSPPPAVDLASQRHVVESFIAAVRSGNIDGLIAILDPDGIGRSGDDTGKVREVRGARNWAEGAVMFGKFAQHMAPALIDGSVGLVLAPHGRLQRALLFRFAEGRATFVDVIVAPDRLAALEISPLSAPTAA